jgi:F0F1-type ATP synthase gamma subunit
LTGVEALLDTGRQGPKVAVLGELDSVVCFDAPDANPETGAAHQCGHHVQLGVMLATAVGLVSSGVAPELAGKVVFMGVPAEEYIQIERRLKLKEEGKVHFIAIGKKAYDALKKRNLPMEDAAIPDIFERLTYENAATIAQQLMDAFTEGQYDSIDIVYNRFVNAASQRVVTQHFLPLLPPEETTSNAGQKKIHTDYIYEPNKSFIIRELIPQNLRMLLYQALLDSVASEHGARMTSMHQATDNATQLISDLTLQYNKARQASITNELVEIVGGAEALNG